MEDLSETTTYRRGPTKFGLYLQYDDPDEGWDPGGWILGLAGPGLTAEYPIGEEAAEQIVDDWVKTGR